MWWVLNKHLLNERMSCMGSSTDPKLHLVPSCFCPHCPAIASKPGINYSNSKKTNYRVSVKRDIYYATGNDCIDNVNKIWGSKALISFLFLLFHWIIKYFSCEIENSHPYLQGWFKCHLLCVSSLISPTGNNCPFPGLPEHLSLPLVS